MKKIRTFSTFRPDYLPTLEYFWYLTQCDIVVLTDHFLYSKRSPVALSPPLAENSDKLRIPVKHNRQQLPIFQKQIDSEKNWQKKHWKTIYHTFHNYPFAFYYLPLLKELFDGFDNRLNAVQKILLKQIAEWLHSPREMVCVSDFFYDKNNNELVQFFSGQFKAYTYLILPHYFTNNWVDASYLKAHKINYRYFATFPDSNLLNAYANNSILKFLMQFGPEAGYLIKQYLDDESQHAQHVS